VIVHPHPVAVRPHVCPAIVPSAHVQLGMAPVVGPHSWSVHVAGSVSSHSMIVQSHAPTAAWTHAGPASVPSSHGKLGERGAGSVQLSGSHTTVC
jgi:hypothetical protein